jgi:PAT family beta-lactamase induction signal transducer AmpG
MPSSSLTLSSSRPLRYVAFFYLYVMQGLPAGFALTAVANYLIAEGASAAAVGSFVAVVGLPWAVQFVWGPVIDRFQHSALGRRKPWVVLSQTVAFLASLGILTISDPVGQLGALSLAFFVHSIFASIQDASVDAMAIGITPENERGRVNAFMRGGMLTGVGLGAALFAYLIRAYGFFPAALAQSLLLLLFTAFTFFLRERPGDALLPARRMHRETPVQPDEAPAARSAVAVRGVVPRTGDPAKPAAVRGLGPGVLCISLFSRALPVHLIQELHWSDTSGVHPAGHVRHGGYAGHHLHRRGAGRPLRCPAAAVVRNAVRWYVPAGFQTCWPRGGCTRGGHGRPGPVVHDRPDLQCGGHARADGDLP